MENPTELQALIKSVCESLLNTLSVSIEDKEKASKVIAHFKPTENYSHVTDDMRAMLWDLITNSDFVCIVTGKEQPILNQEGAVPVELKTLFCGKGEIYNFGNAIAWLCMQGAQQGFGESAVNFLARANQMAVANTKQLPTARPKIEIVS